MSPFNPWRVDLVAGAYVPEPIRAYLNCLLNQQGFPYTWPTEQNRYSGKGLPGCLYPLGRDCSGTVSFALRGAGDLIDRRADWNAEKYATECAKTDAPEAGDLVVYVSPLGRAVHIETVMEDGRFYGAIGAGSECTSPVIAMSRKPPACVQYRERPYPLAHGRAEFRVNPLRKGV